MRVRRLDLVRYGHFTDYSLHLEEAPDSPGFHVVYGANEAGKTTIKNAFVDLLYGISPRTPYNFRHENDVLQIAARLEIAGREHELVRIRKNTGDLLDSNGQPVSENILKAALGDITRGSFCNMFSLDEETLQAGGNSILKSEGDLGELLFSAAAGLSGLSQALGEIRDASARFYKRPGRKYELNELKHKLRGLDDEIRRLDTQAPEYDRLKKQEETLRENYQKANEAYSRTKEQTMQLKALIDALGPWRERQKLAGELAGMEAMPDLPDGWLDEAMALSRKDATVRAEQARLEKAIEKARQQYDEIIVDETVLALGEAIERLQGDDLEARYKTARDIEPRQRERDLVKDQISDLVRQLGQGGKLDPDELLLPVHLIARLQDLMEQRSGLESEEKAARREYDKACAAFRKMNEAGHGLARLAPWRGTLEDLQHLDVPGMARLETLKDRLQSLLDEQKSLAQEKTRLEDEIAGLTAGITERLAGSEEIDDEVAIKVRQERDEAWRAHRALFANGASPAVEDLEKSADIFAAAMARDDRTGQLRFLQSAKVAAHDQDKQSLAKCRAGLARTLEKQDSVNAKVKEARQAVAKIMQGLGLPPDTSLTFLERWLERREALLGELEKCQQILVGREDDLNRAKKAHDNWKREWKEALKASWMGKDGKDLTPVEVNASLRIIAMLPEKQSALKELENRIEAMKADRAAYIREVKRLAAGAAISFDADNPVKTADALRKSLDDNRLAQKKRADKHHELEELQRQLAQEKNRAEAIAARFSVFSKRFACDGFEQLITLMQQAEKRASLQKQLASYEDTVCSLLTVENVKAAGEIMADIMASPEKPGQVKAQYEALQKTAEVEEKLLSDLLVEWKNAERKLQAIAGDDAVARLCEEREAQLLEIRSKAERFLRQSAGVLAVQHAMDEFRNRHRSTMMENASRAFSEITLGCFSGLKATPDRDREILVGIRNDNSSITAPKMSRGTRFQLYLALRMAGHGEFTRHREALPFFADDILEPFDDDRSAVTFSLLGELSKTGQVVYFTHHKHLCDIARQACGDSVAIHEIPSAVP